MREETELKACVSEVLDDVGSSAQVAWMGNGLQTGEGAPSDFLWSTFLSSACIPHRHAVCYQPLICFPVEGHHQHAVCVLSPVFTLYGPQIWRPSRNLNVCALSTWREGSDQCLISSCRIPLSLCCLGVRLFTEHHHDFVVSFYLVPVCCHRFSCDKPNDRCVVS